MAAVQITATQDLPVAIKLADRKGNPGTPDGVPEWATDNTDVLALTPAADGLSCTVSAVGMLGTATVQVTADAEFGSGVTAVIGTLEVEVTPGKATVVTIEPGTPTEQPA
jgi:hypothetical protein